MLKSKYMSKKYATERQEQEAFVQWLKLKKIPHFHIPNGGKRDILEAKALKRQGVSAGVPDICIPIPSPGYHGLFIELKRAKGGVLSLNQREWINLLRKNGYYAICANGCDEAIKEVEIYIS